MADIQIKYQSNSNLAADFSTQSDKTGRSPGKIDHAFD